VQVCKVFNGFCVTNVNLSSVLSQRRYAAPPNQAGLKLKSVIGYNGNGRGNMIWHADSGMFVDESN